MLPFLHSTLSHVCAVYVLLCFSNNFWWCLNISNFLTKFYFELANFNIFYILKVMSSPIIVFVLCVPFTCLDCKGCKCSIKTFYTPNFYQCNHSFQEEKELTWCVHYLFLFISMNQMYITVQLDTYTSLHMMWTNKKLHRKSN